MLKNLLILPDGTELFSGAGITNAIRSVTLTQCVNSGDDLTIGSVCANMLEATLITPNGGLSLTAGDEVTLYKVDKEDTHHKVGIFILEQPTRPTAHTMKLTGYDRVTKLDKDLTEWLKELNGWPYNILTFAKLVCNACGVRFVASEVPNQSYFVEQFTKSGVTGRQLMRWIGEVCCRFIRANADGSIEMGWYEPLTTHGVGYKAGTYDEVLYDEGTGTVSFSSEDITSSCDDDAGNVTIDSNRFVVTDDGQSNVTLTLEGCLETLVYFQNGLSYEEYTVAPIDLVQVSLAEGNDAYRFPVAAKQDDNCYVITGNPFLNNTTDTVLHALQTIWEQLWNVTYTPCKVSLPADLNVQVGQIVRITDKNGKRLMMYVMRKTTTGQRDVLECTGSRRRDSTTAQNNQSIDAVAQQKVDAQTQEDIFNKLTNGGKAQGIYLKDGFLYINAEYIKSGKIAADYIDVKSLTVDAAQITGVLDADRINGATLKITAGATITGWNVGDNVLSVGTAGTDNFIGLYSKYPSTNLQIGNINSNNWRIVAGTKFGVTRDGLLSAADVDISGKITATSGKIAGWTIGDTSLTAGTFGTQGFIGLYTSYPTSENYRLVIGSKFKVNRDGELTASGGTIGGWTISNNKLSGETGVGEVEISPLGVYGPYDDNGTTRYSLFTWLNILTAANSL